MYLNLKERIAKAIEYSGLMQIELAKVLNIPQQRISDMIRGIYKNPKLKVLIELAKICKVDLRWLITGEGEMIKSDIIKIGPEDLTWVPIVGTVTAGAVTYAEEVRDGKIGFFAKEVPKDAFALKISGDSMIPELEMGDIVVCAPTQLENLQGKGEIVAVRINADTKIKCLHKNKKEIILASVNRAYQPIIVTPYEIGAIAKVMFKIKKY